MRSAIIFLIIIYSPSPSLPSPLPPSHSLFPSPLSSFSLLHHSFILSLAVPHSPPSPHTIGTIPQYSRCLSYHPMTCRNISARQPRSVPRVYRRVLNMTSNMSLWYEPRPILSLKFFSLNPFFHDRSPLFSWSCPYLSLNPFFMTALINFSWLSINFLMTALISFLMTPLPFSWPSSIFHYICPSLSGNPHSSPQPFVDFPVHISTPSAFHSFANPSVHHAYHAFSISGISCRAVYVCSWRQRV